MSATSPRPDLSSAAALPRRPWRRVGADALGRLRRLPVWATWLALGLLLGVLAAREARTSAVQAHLLAALNQRLTYALVPGPSARFVAPRHGPYDFRLGYVRLPEWTARLEREGFEVREQAELSPTLGRVAKLGLTPPYAEKTRAGLSVVKAVIEGIHVMRSNPALAKRALGRRLQIKDEKELEETYQLLKSFIQIKPYPALEGFKTIFDDFAKRIPAAKNANAKDFVDTRFIDEFDKSGYIDGLYR
jgi:hypothetical protein